MILVIVGTHTQGFDRLVRAADELAAFTDEKVIIQYGSSLYKPECAAGYDWLTSSEMERLTKEARVVIAHAGAGTIISALKTNKPLIIAPRLERYHENHNDHQLQLANALQTKGLAVVVQALSGEILQLAVGEAARLDPGQTQEPLLIHALKVQLDFWARQGSTKRR